MKVRKVVLMIVDTGGLEDFEVKEVIENTKYPNWCISPEVMDIESVEVEWGDEHPLNHNDTCSEEFERLFKK